jgi:predicted lipoprotein with Yx(FWY)xxD motif
MRKSPLLAAGVAALAAGALAVAGCGGSGGSSTMSSSGASAQHAASGGSAGTSSASASSAISVRSTPLGKILVDANGRTLYLFEADKPDMSNCSGACLTFWPAFTANAKPQANGGAVASKVGTITGTDGKQQVTYNGHPLYYYAADQKPGDTAGEGLNQFGAAWDVLAANGNGIDEE